MRNLTFVLVLLQCSLVAPAQKPQTHTSSDIQLALQKLEVLGSVLYIAAHPDDENTRLITWLANDKKYRTAYLSLTRGDGGQNLIGPELRERLGVIRTQELLEARKLDGGMQFFTRANDFGFSKHPDETFSIWDREAILADVVWVIRKFRPDVIITRFSTEAGVTHGHHTASALLAEEAFAAAADPKRFPDQLKQVQVWQASRLLWNTSSWFFRGREDQFDTTDLVSLNMGGYNPLLGKSYTELAAESRSMHRSQGFGTPLSRESSTEFLKPILGSRPQGELLSGIATSWSRVPGGGAITTQLAAVRQGFDPLAPWKSLPGLVALHNSIRQLPDNPYKTVKLQELERIIQACAGVFVEASTARTSAAPGTELPLQLEVVSRAPVSVTLQALSLPEVSWDTTLVRSLDPHVPFFLKHSLRIAPTAEISQPYWLQKEATKGMFQFDKADMAGEPQNGAPLHALVRMTIEGLALAIQVPLVHKHVDPAIGEVYQPFVITPPIMVTPLQDQLIFSDDTPQQLQVRVRAGKALEAAELSLALAPGWKSQPAQLPIRGLREGEERLYSFQLSPPKKAGTATIEVQARLEGTTYTRGFEQLLAPHFPVQTLFPQARLGAVRLDLKRDGKQIGYIMGAGDAVPTYLSHVGYEVSLLNPAGLSLAQLRQYDAVLLGIRAFNTQESLRHTKDVLEAYAREGGVVIIQYNTSHELVSSSIAPYQLRLGRGRVTDEEAPVRILAPEHPALNYPNKITAKDFDGWVQERGLYFAESWSAEWVPLLASQDGGEQPLEGGLLVAPVGKGYYVYGGYSWFRQLPEGVPGAYRLLANLLALGKGMPK
ncbi:PIG-L family deacetylase [Cesiribacter andamanensis]|nr:PIG-L family deacetylase [Cesiribacter andamanensis]